MPLDTTNWPSLAETEVIDETTALLIRARSYLVRGWCRGTYASDKSGFSVGYGEAARWCALGALSAAGWGHRDFEHSAFRRLTAAIGGGSIPDFNDAQDTVEPVLAAFDRAIATGRAED